MRQVELGNDRDVELEFSKALKDHSLSGKVSSLYHVKTEGLCGIYKNIALSPGVSVSYIDLHLKRDLCFSSRSVVPRMVEMGFSTRGIVHFRMKGNRKAFDNYPGQCYLSFAHGPMDIEISAPGGQMIQLVEAHFEPEIFDEYCRDRDCALPKKLQPYAENCHESIIKCPCVLPAHMEDLHNRIIQRARESIDASLALEESVSDLTACIVQYLKNGMQSSGAVLSSGDIERIREARHILESRMDDPPGLFELSRMVNLNDYKLKTGFRQAFGCTVHQALVEIRLDRAYKLLHQGFSVSEAALAVGYSNMGDFAATFRKRFNHPPGSIRSVFTA